MSAEAHPDRQSIPPPLQHVPERAIERAKRHAPRERVLDRDGAGRDGAADRLRSAAHRCPQGVAQALVDASRDGAMDRLDRNRGPRNRRERLPGCAYRSEGASRDSGVHLLDPRRRPAHGFAGQITEGLDLDRAHVRFKPGPGDIRNSWFNIPEMLLRQEGRSVLAIPQQSHAWISGQLARVWGNDRFPSPEPWEEVCLAAEQHDIGMAGWDLEPTLNPDTGLPHSFLEMPLEVHLGLWDAAPRRLLVQSRYAALLVSMHGSRLYRRRNLDELEAAQAEAVRSYLERQRAFQEWLIASL